MTLAKIDGLNQRLAFIAVAIGVVALILVCVGIGTPKWESTYTSTGNGTYALASTANFFYACSYTNGTFNNCTTRSNNLTNYPGYSSIYPWEVDYNLRMQNAAGLCIAGIIFLALAIAMTVVMALRPLATLLNLISPILFFLACLFMLAGMAEGSRYLLYNDYSANLYQAGHLFTILALTISTLAAGRIQFFRMKEEQAAAAIAAEKAKKTKKPDPK
jgi:hypothetical protein